MIRRLSAVAGLAALACPMTAAGTLKVPKHFGTIQEAVDAAVPGDVIVVRAGTYDENLTITNKTDLVVRGKGKVLIRPPLPINAILASGCASLTLERLHVDGSLGTAIRILSGDDVLVRRCVVNANNEGILVASAAGVRLERNRVANAGVGMYLVDVSGAVLRKNRVRDSGAGIGFVECQSFTAEDNRIDECTSGLAAGTSDGGLIAGNHVEDVESGIGVLESDTLTVVDNRLDRCSGIAIGNPLDGTDSLGVGILHNRIADCDSGVVMHDSFVVVEDNVILRAAGDAIRLGAAEAPRISRNVVRDSDSGIRLVLCSGASVTDNLVSRPLSAGYVVDSDSTANVLSGNRVKKSGFVGLHLQGDNNVLIGNVLTKSAFVDLSVDVDAAGNVLTANVFGSSLGL